MKGINKWIVLIEWIAIVIIFCDVILKDWNKVPVVKDYFALLIIGELIIESWSRIKTKTNNKI
jgi:hypothetical protein